MSESDVEVRIVVDTSAFCEAALDAGLLAYDLWERAQRDDMEEDNDDA